MCVRSANRVGWGLPVLLVILGSVAPAPAQVGETALPGDVASRLDTFEAQMLTKANQTFAATVASRTDDKILAWRQAYAEYEAFLTEFSRSPVVPFVLLRKGRCKQEENKIFEAIAHYEEVLDYFPNEIEYAAPALYRIGECHWSKGDIVKAMKAWAEMANDKDYSKHRLAAYAVNKLADNLMKQDKVIEAVKYYEQVAVDFIHSNRDAANNAAGPVIRYYVRQNPSEEKYRDFYLKRFGRSLDRQAPLDQNVKYWQDLMTAVGGHGAFDELAAEERDRYYRYWIGKLKGKFPAEDDYQLTLLNWQLLADRNQAAWATGVDKQFEIGYKPGDSDRVIKWMGIYRENRQKVDQYYQKLDLAAMDFNALSRLMNFLYRIGRQEQARNILGHFKFDQLSDAQIEGLARSLWHVDNARVKDIYFRMKDNNKAKFNFMEFCHWRRNAGEGLPMATELTALPAYAKNAWAKKADFLVWTKQYNEAIAAYRMVDNPPGNLWSIVSCYTALGTTDAAISQLGEIERFFESESSRAALAIAEIHSKTGAKEKYISALRGILKKYPNSGESSVAHQRLEALGVKIGGAVDAR